MSAARVFPLCVHADDAVLAWRAGQAVFARQFMAEAAQIAAVLPTDCGHVLNLCADRLRFALGFAACLATDKTCLLPPTRAADAIDEIARRAPDTVCLRDKDEDSTSPVANLPTICLPENFSALPQPAARLKTPHIDAARTVAFGFTSGSTGAPTAHAKRFGELVLSARAVASAISLLEKPVNVLGTVPPQHMYGLESTLFLPWQTGGAFAAECPFYPADIAAALWALPAPRLLVTTPFHLRVLLDAGLPLPELAGILSAAAALPMALACRAEAELAAPLWEIYGSTETGQIALRRSAETEVWQLLSPIELQEKAGRFYAGIPHLTPMQVLADHLKRQDERHFRWLGRDADLINIAGKRASLADLNHQLLSIDGVQDGVFFMPESADDPAHIARLAAFVVAPGQTEQPLRKALARRIDAAFMPRPLILLPGLPRDARGKLSKAVCERLLVRHRRQAPLNIPANHPAKPGHFPGQPIVPGVVLLEMAASALAQIHDWTSSCWRLDQVKFLRPVTYGATLSLSWSPPSENGNIAFTLQEGNAAVVRAKLAVT